MKRLFTGLMLCFFALGFAASATPASAQDYPNKPIRLVVGFAGGGGEAIVRMLAEKVSATLKQPIIVEPISAASGVQAAGIVARAAPDGYTLLAGNSVSHIIKPLTLKSISYDPIRDFTPIAFLSVPTLVLAVRADLGISDVPSFLERSKKTRTLVGVPGVGSTGHVYMLALNKAAAGALEAVPYKDDSSLMLGLLGGNIESAIAVGSTINRVLEGTDNASKIRIVGLFNSGPRPGFEGVKTVTEQLQGFRELTAFSAFWGPAGLPQNIALRLNAAITEALQDPIIRDRMLALGAVAMSGPPDKLGNTIKEELPRFGALLKEAGIEPE